MDLISLGFNDNWERFIESCEKKGIEKFIFEGEIVMGFRDVLPNNLTINGRLEVTSRIEYLPDNLTVNGETQLGQAYGIKKLPKNLTVNGMFIIGPNVEQIPSNAKFSGVFSSTYSSVKILPDNMNLSFLNLYQSVLIRSLPKGLVVDDLNISQTFIKNLPNDIKVNWNLEAAYSSITHLPDNLHLKGYMSIADCKLITSLPKGLVIGDTLSIDNTNIKSLPEDLVCEGNIYIAGSALSKDRDLVANYSKKYKIINEKFS
jgi:hypothetical protein